MTLNGIATGDWHFCGLAKHFPDDIARQMYEIDKIYQYAVRNGVEHIFVNGDIADTPHLPYEVYIQLVLFLKKYDGIITTHYIAGNHDFSDIKKTSMDLLDLLYREGFFETFHLYLQPHSTKISGVPVNFLPYPCNEAPEHKKPHLNFSHVAYNGAVGDNGRKLRVKNEFIQSEGDFNISGHIHQYQSLPSKSALYAGNPFQKNFGESLPKGFVHFKAKATNNRIAIKHKFIDSKPDFKLLNIAIESREDFAKLSTSDAYRYKLWVDPSVEIPKDLRLRFPNITGGIFDLTTNKIASEDEHIRTVVSEEHLNRINVRSGLTKFIKNAGFKKKDAKTAHTLVKKACNELGIDMRD